MVLFVIITTRCPMTPEVLARPTGRPRQDPPAHLCVNVRMTAELYDAVDEYRHANRISSRADAIRRLIEDGLELNRITKRTK